MTIESRQLKVSRLQLRRYFVTQLNIIANPLFDVTKDVIQKESDFCVNGEMSKNGEDPSLFQVKLNINIQPSPESNLPYSIVLEIVGIIKSAFTGTDEQIERVVFVNGSTMVYSTAREIIRASTSFGPYAQLMLPSVAFSEPKKPNDGVVATTPPPAFNPQQ